MAEPFVTARDTQFQLDNAPFPVIGVNCYFLAYCSDASRRTLLATAKEMGTNVIRCWAFLDVEDFTPGRVAFQYFKDGVLVVNDGPDGLERLDALIKAAEDFGIKLILPLVNHWEAFGGMPLYVKWFAPQLGGNSNVTEFYRSRVIRDAYRNWLMHVLTRRNTYTGRLYAEEPAIMAWELTNEARCETGGGRELLLDWIGEMSRFVKELDPNHLLALGDEGMLNRDSGFDLFKFKKPSHLYDGSHGVDWQANLDITGIDFGTFHFYPQDWGHANDLDFASRWINDHVSLAQRMNKPVLMEEFGLRLDSNLVRTPQDRDAWFGRWLQSANELQSAGNLLWMLSGMEPDVAGYKDDYVVYSGAEVPAITAYAKRILAASA